MQPELALNLAMITSFVVFGFAAVLHWHPWLAARPLVSAATALLWVHAFRHIALQVFSSQAAEFPISDGLVDQIAWGDYAGMVLALGSIVAWRYAPRVAVPLSWLFVAATVVDLVNAAVGGGSAVRRLTGYYPAAQICEKLADLFDL